MRQPRSPRPAALLRALAALARWGPWLSLLPGASAYDPRHWPLDFEVRQHLRQPGRLQGQPLEVSWPCAFAPDNKLLVHPGLLEDPAPLAELLAARLHAEPGRGWLEALLLDLLLNPDPEQQLARLRAAGLDPQRPPGAGSAPGDDRPGRKADTSASVGTGRGRRGRVRARPSLPGGPGEAPSSAGAPQPPPDEEQLGFWARLRRWVRGEEEPAKPAARPPGGRRPRPPRPEPPEGRSGRSRGGRRGARRRPRRPPPSGAGSTPTYDGTPPEPAAGSHAGWFQPRQAVDPQPGGAQAWLQDRRHKAEFGFTFAPSRLALPWSYAPHTLTERFDRRSQRWLAEGSPAEWRQGHATRAGLLRMRGRLPGGEALLPLPLHASVLTVDGAEPLRWVTLPNGAALVLLPQATEVRVEIALQQAPDFAAGGQPPDAPRALLRPTAPDPELPDEAHDQLSDLRHGSTSPFDAALTLRDWVRRRYRYDPSYLESPELARWLASLSAGRANRQLALLHAGRSGNFLGAGVCYELNVLLCELLRRAGIPAAIATGWTLERGALSEPDHLWAMALLPTDLGPRWMPLDAATTTSGRPLRARVQPTGRWRVRAPRPAKRPDASWARRAARTQAPPAGSSGPSPPVDELVRVLRHLLQSQGSGEPDGATLRQRARELLESPDALLEWWEGE